MFCTSPSYYPLLGDVCNINDKLQWLIRKEKPILMSLVSGFHEVLCQWENICYFGWVQNKKKKKTSRRCLEFNMSNESVGHYNPMYPIAFCIWTLVALVLHLPCLWATDLSNQMWGLEFPLWVTCGKDRNCCNVFEKGQTFFQADFAKGEHNDEQSGQQTRGRGDGPGERFGRNLISSWEFYGCYV